MGKEQILKHPVLETKQRNRRMNPKKAEGRRHQRYSKPLVKKSEEKVKKHIKYTISKKDDKIFKGNKRIQYVTLCR
jgi:hypothetical protein